VNLGLGLDGEVRVRGAGGATGSPNFGRPPCHPYAFGFRPDPTEHVLSPLLYPRWRVGRASRGHAGAKRRDGTG